MALSLWDSRNPSLLDANVSIGAGVVCGGEENVWASQRCRLECIQASRCVDVCVARYVLDRSVGRCKQVSE